MEISQSSPEAATIDARGLKIDASRQATAENADAGCLGLNGGGYDLGLRSPP